MTQLRLKKLNEQVDAVYGAGLGLNMSMVAEIIMEDLPVSWFNAGATPWADMKALIIDRCWTKA